MQPHLFPTLSLVLIITIIFLCPWPSTFVSAEDERYQNCSATFDCGNITNIGYPFWGSNRPDYCGHPAFHLNCTNNNTTEITIMNLTYQVLDINSESQNLKVARKDYIGGICPNLLYNTTLDTTFFTYTSDIQNVTLYYGCPNIQNPFPTGQGISNQFTCNLNGSDITCYYATRNLDSFTATILSTLGTCSNSVVVPATQSAVQTVESSPTKENLVIALDQGFGMQWSTANDNTCETCKLSSGFCGYNSTTRSFACYCSDQPYPFSCGGSASNQPQSDGSKSNKVSLGVGLGIAGAAAVGIGLGCWFLLIIQRRKRTAAQTESKDLPTPPSSNKGQRKREVCRNKKIEAKENEKIEAFIMNYHSLMPKRYSYTNIEKMTNSFMNKLGQGGFGGVYKGKLPDGRSVAVKVLNKSIGDGEEFINEVASISRTSHVNIVTLLGFCYERTKRALIYEYMPNGSLDNLIYDEESHKRNTHLEWKTLYNVAIGIARGLEYLHRGCNTRIVHFDIKPQNVLLDKDFCPKISDFGLAKLCKGRESIVSMLGARGTPGYTAPEVFMRSFGGVSYKSDVYSYGMMILEMFGGTNVNDVGLSESSEMYFPDSLYKRLELGQNSTADENIKAEEEETIRRMMIIGLWCIQTNPSDRPSMTKVVEMLEGDIQSLQIPPKPLLFSTSTTAPVPLDYSNTLSSTTYVVLSQRDEDKVFSLVGVELAPN